MGGVQCVMGSKTPEKKKERGGSHAAVQEAKV